MVGESELPWKTSHVEWKKPSQAPLITTEYQMFEMILKTKSSYVLEKPIFPDDQNQEELKHRVICFANA
nr:hypothetical protein Itr_chr03CG12830 [Ipomoea trifida]